MYSDPNRMENTMIKDFNAFIADKSEKNAKRVLKHAGKISAQCVYGPELAEAKKIMASQ